VFDPPAPISEPTFTRQLLSQGIQLDLKSRLLVSNAQFYLNGEPVVLPQSDHPILLRLADHRCLSAADLDKASAECIGFMYERFLAGYLMF